MDGCVWQLRMHEQPSQNPDALWAQITSTYLHIVPHPEISWWARRGQLAEPLYMVNYGVAAILVSDMRAACSSFLRDGSCYARMRDLLFACGSEIPSRHLISRVLNGRSPNPEALIAELRGV